MQTLSFGPPILRRLSAKTRKANSARRTPRRPQLKKASTQKPREGSTPKRSSGNNSNDDNIYHNATSSPNSLPHNWTANRQNSPLRGEGPREARPVQSGPRAPAPANPNNASTLQAREGLRRLLCQAYKTADELYGGRNAFSEEVHRICARYAGDIAADMLSKQKNNIIKLTSGTLLAGLVWKFPVLNIFRHRGLAIIGFLMKHAVQGKTMVEVTEKQLAGLLRSIASKLPGMGKVQGAASFASVLIFRILGCLPGPKYAQIIAGMLRTILGSVFGVWLPDERFQVIIHRNARSLEAFVNHRKSLMPILQDLISNELKPNELLEIHKALNHAREWGTREMTNRLHATFKMSPPKSRS